MSNNKFTWTGLQELKAALRSLPADLAGEAGHLVEGHANRAASTIKSGYPSRSGALRDKLEVEHAASRFGARSVVRNRSRYADEFEYGSQARHTAIGADRGSMPANPLFTQTIVRARRAMYGDLKALLERHGLTVSGDA